MLLGFIEILNMGFDAFNEFWKILSYYLFEYCFFPIYSLTSLGT